MLPITAATLREIGPRYRAGGASDYDQKSLTDLLGPFLVPFLANYLIDTPLRIIHFLGQTCFESAGFRTVVEFASGAEYEGRKDLGNTVPGDAVRYKGRGLIQLTGRANYAAMRLELGEDIVASPELVETPRIALETACIYWAKNHINAMADRDDIIAVTRAINGGVNGLEDRRMYTEKARSVIMRMAADEVAPSKAPGPDTLPILRRGSKGVAVTVLQRALRDAGYIIVVDGDFGPATEKAVKAYQAANLERWPLYGTVDSSWWNLLLPGT